MIYLFLFEGAGSNPAGVDCFVCVVLQDPSQSGCKVTRRCRRKAISQLEAAETPKKQVPLFYGQPTALLESNGNGQFFLGGGPYIDT